MENKEKTLGLYLRLAITRILMASSSNTKQPMESRLTSRKQNFSFPPILFFFFLSPSSPYYYLKYNTWFKRGKQQDYNFKCCVLFSVKPIANTYTDGSNSFLFLTMKKKKGPKRNSCWISIRADDPVRMEFVVVEKKDPATKLKLWERFNLLFFFFVKISYSVGVTLITTKETITINKK